MTDYDGDTDEQCELASAYESMVDMFAQMCPSVDASNTNSYDANDETLDDAVLRWWGLHMLSQQDIALGERGTRSLERATAEAARDLWDVHTGVLQRYNASSTSESDGDAGDEDDEDEVDEDDEADRGPADGKRTRRQ